MLAKQVMALITAVVVVIVVAVIGGFAYWEYRSVPSLDERQAQSEGIAAPAREDTAASDSVAASDGRAESSVGEEVDEDIAEAEDVPGDGSLIEQEKTKQTEDQAAGDIPGDKSLIQPRSDKTVTEAAPAEIPGDKSLITPPVSAEASKVQAETPPAQTAEAVAEVEEIPGDKSLIDANPIETAQADDQSQAEIPGDKGLLEAHGEQPVASTPPQRPRPPVVFKTVDYQDTGPNTGTMSLGGVGNPGARILLFFDDKPLGQVRIGEDGTWSFEIEKWLEPGMHRFRADHFDEATGLVMGRASVNLQRVPPTPSEEGASD